MLLKTGTGHGCMARSILQVTTVDGREIYHSLRVQVKQAARVGCRRLQDSHPQPAKERLRLKRRCGLEFVIRCALFALTRRLAISWV